MIGFILVDKPSGPTSHDVVDVVRRRLGLRKVGHAGTLDPPASGLLVVGVGPATRLMRWIQDAPKVYTATGVLGVRTTTLDAAGEIVSTEPVGDVTREAVEAVLPRFTGEIQQVPPVVSAIKVDGKRAYKRAAAGEQVEMKPRSVTVHELEVTRVEGHEFDVRLKCSSGTYVRSLVADIGDVLGCGAHVLHLRREAIGTLDVADAIGLDDIDVGQIRAISDTLTDMPHLVVDAAGAAKARTGQTMEADVADGEVLMIGPDDTVGVFMATSGQLRPVAVLPSQA